jgi:hypothetical protein
MAGLAGGGGVSYWQRIPREEIIAPDAVFM